MARFSSTQWMGIILIIAAAVHLIPMLSSLSMVATLAVLVIGIIHLIR